MTVSPLMRVLTDICAATAPVLSDVCDEPMDFAIVAWPKDRPDKPTLIATTPSRREVNAVLGCAIAINGQAAAAAGNKDH